jgi:hypothetical protein
MCTVHVIQCVFSKLTQDVYGNTPLISACQHETARVLLDHGAAMDYHNKVNSFNAH